MARATYVLRNGKLVEKHLASPLHARHRQAPNIRTDGMEPIRSMADGKVYDSKSTYERSVRAHGCEIVGNERTSFDRRADFTPARGEIARDVKQSIEQLRSRG